jgi:hypothetical protein
MKYNGVVVDKIEEKECSSRQKNHKLIIHLNTKQFGEKENEK